MIINIIKFFLLISLNIFLINLFFAPYSSVNASANKIEYNKTIKLKKIAILKEKPITKEKKSTKENPNSNQKLETSDKLNTNNIKSSFFEKDNEKIIESNQNVQDLSNSKNDSQNKNIDIKKRFVDLKIDLTKKINNKTEKIELLKLYRDNNQAEEFINVLKKTILEEELINDLTSINLFNAFVNNKINDYEKILDIHRRKNLGFDLFQKKYKKNRTQRLKDVVNQLDYIEKVLLVMKVKQ